MLSIDLDIGNVVLEDSGDVNLDAMLAIEAPRFVWARCGEEGSLAEAGSPGIGEPKAEAVYSNAGLKDKRLLFRCSGAKMMLREPTYLREGTLGENTDSRSESVLRRVDHEEMAAKRQSGPRPTEVGRARRKALTSASRSCRRHRRRR